MSATATIPITWAERLDLGPKTMYFPASWEEYIELLPDLEYRTEYDNHHIIAMSIATDPHETLVANILGILYQLLEDKPDMKALGSNRHVYLAEFQADYAPGVSVVSISF